MMNTPVSRPIAARKTATLTTPPQPSTSSGAAEPSAGAAAAAADDEDEWAAGVGGGGGGLSHPSFACDERALNEMRLAVGSILESNGFTHAAASALELLTDVGVRYMRKLATTATRTAEMDGRTRPTDADVLAGYAAMRVDIDEMNEYMRQVRPAGDVRVIPAFPLAIAPNPIVFTPVPPACLLPPPDIGFPGLPPMSTQWLRPEDLEQMAAARSSKEDEKEADAEEKRPADAEEIKKMLSAFSFAEAVPSFVAKSAAAFGLRKGDRTAERRRGVRVEEEKEDSRGKKRKNNESNKLNRAAKQARNAAAANAATSAAAYYPQDDQPGTSASFASRPPSRAHTPAALPPPAGSILALRESTRAVLATSSANLPLAGALAPDYAHAHTDAATPLRIPGLLAAFGRGSSENREQPSPLARPASPPQSPPLTEGDLMAAVDPTAPPHKLVRMAIMRTLFLKEYPKKVQLDKEAHIAQTLALIKSASVGGTSSAAAAPPARAATAAKAAAAAAASGHKSTPLPPPPPPITPRLTIKPLIKPPTPEQAPAPLTATPLAPLRLKINIGPRPSNDAASAPPTPAAAAAAAAAAEAVFQAATVPFVDDEDAHTAGPSSASTIPLLFSPATAAAAAAAAGEQPAEMAEEEEGDEESKKKKKKHKKEKKEKKEKKKREDADGEGGGEEEKREKKHKKHKKSAKDREPSPSRAASPAPPPPETGGLKLKIRLGPRTAE